jgi:hypothetical protein
VNQALSDLLRDERLIALGNYVAPLGLFRAIGVQQDELSTALHNKGSFITAACQLPVFSQNSTHG